MLLSVLTKNQKLGTKERGRGAQCGKSKASPPCTLWACRRKVIRGGGYVMSNTSSRGSLCKFGVWVLVLPVARSSGESVCRASMIREKVP